MEFTQKNGYFNYKRNEQAKYWMYESINDTLRETFYHNPAVESMLNLTEQQVLNNEISSFVAAKRMMDLFLENLSAKKEINGKEKTYTAITKLRGNHGGSCCLLRPRICRLQPERNLRQRRESLKRHPGFRRVERCQNECRRSIYTSRTQTRTIYLHHHSFRL